MSFLNCCGGSQTSNDVDLDEQPVPARKSTKLQSLQSNAAKPQENSAAESSTAESKETDEKIGGPPYADLKSAGEPKIQESSKLASAPGAKALATQPSTAEKQSDSSPNADPKRASQPKFPNGAVDTLQDSDRLATAPVVDVAGDKVGTAAEDNMINERTPTQEQDDAALADVPPVDTMAADAPTATGDNKSDSTPPLPPPPPPPIAPRRQPSSTSGHHNRNVSNQANNISEQQKWLLPPIKPEFKGKKCLVLDLDETLVHSSFKV